MIEPETEMDPSHMLRRYKYSEFFSGVGIATGAYLGYAMGQEITGTIDYLKDHNSVNLMTNLLSTLTGMEITSRVAGRAGDLVARVVNVFDR